MTDFKFFKADRVYNELFYQFPKVFIVSDEYKKMKDSTKIAYMLLKARLEIAISKRQIDEEGNVYFTYTTNELCRVLNCQKQKAIAIKKELESFGLLLQKQMGFNKQLGKNNPNRLYLAELKVSENDIYLLEKFDRENRENVDKSEGMKIIPELNNNILDTNRHNIDTEKDRLQDQLLLDNFETIMTNDSIATFVPERVLNLIKTFSSSYSEAQKTVQTIHNAKKKAEIESGISIVFEELDSYYVNAEQELYTTLLKAYQKLKTEKVENIQNLIFVYVKNWFIEKPIAAKVSSEKRLNYESSPSTITKDWLE
ncbi:replication initiator protein A [Enterococcus faecium]|uniref:replication initiator protein A n=1 Tax=Enterococcus TaxID=1350 RepID=UPI00028259BC|nr:MULTISPECIES: replication initiator protein A [Enterococcus]EJX40693.1 replication initiator protein A [Enterococcus faecium S447]EJX60620.1 replication initiator protein A [Enterococcus faecium R446]EJY08419.1 replication initiator protein A [Enterococcus faecium E422]MBG0383872.1 replication initiator protein A [Enterococcus faecium]MBK1096456.1 replication initiator protein A [Enterococcus faecium]